MKFLVRGTASYSENSCELRANFYLKNTKYKRWNTNESKGLKEKLDQKSLITVAISFDFEATTK